jgi:hypothetical protein
MGRSLVAATRKRAVPVPEGNTRPPVMLVLPYTRCVNEGFVRVPVPSLAVYDVVA